ncbi:MAG: rRNA pseudouridine synthase [Bacteroides sp.]|nr:rRNA pseudouridine synthase [Prevotella sp.]MCM1407314.1 rRNA pseudouridine synthase [Treponema brennaborense]MCM1469804.1 rRNA pseudouridine synthase [Bacteroides sp.]
MNKTDIILPDENHEQTSVRLQLYLARCGVASRRACEAVIASGRVSVNGSVVTEMGIKVSPADTVCVDGNQVAVQNTKKYVLLNKPAGYVCSFSDEKGRAVALDLVQPYFSERLYNVGRLDMFSSGLIIFTNDGNFAAKISHPSAELEKEYIVDTSLPVPDELPERFEKGLRINNVFYACRRAEKIGSRQVRIILTEGKNREIRRVFDYFERGIKRLTRIRIGTVSITGLQPGQFRELSIEEVKSLLSCCRNGI